jgi:hypothetical protein
MKKVLLLLALFLTLIPQNTVFAMEDPLSSANNKFGIHILFDSELDEAKKLVNSNGGDWGYVIIPLQAGDKDLDKWQKFMDKAYEDHLIPIVRLATEGDYFNTSVWRKPQEEDVIDFANFLNSLTWPTQNRYIVVFNEINRGDEWGGDLDPAYYAQLLSYTVTVFKSLNPDFFIISGGLDNAAPNQGKDYMNEYTFMREMDEAVPGIFNQVDGFSSHSYPNPGFSQPPTVKTDKSISSFSYERELLSQLTSKKLPIFITETGWSSQRVSEDDRAKYYKQAFQTVWNDPQIAAVTPFVLRASGPFEQFTFIKGDTTYTKQYTAIKDLPKIKGTPKLAQRVLSASSTIESAPVEKSFNDDSNKSKTNPAQLSKMLRGAFKWVMQL